VRLAERVPRFVAPMLLPAAASASREDGWLVEVKWDGVRAQALLDCGRLTVRSRRGRDCTAQFPELADAPPTAAAKRTLLLDGELVCFNQQGRPDFAPLRGRLARSGAGARAHAARHPVADRLRRPARRRARGASPSLPPAA
jgi:bifunctional non-homologous end joining protein LigD